MADTTKKTATSQYRFRILVLPPRPLIVPGSSLAVVITRVNPRSRTRSVDTSQTTTRAFELGLAASSRRAVRVDTPRRGQTRSTTIPTIDPSQTTSPRDQTIRPRRSIANVSCSDSRPRRPRERARRSASLSSSRSCRTSTAASVRFTRIRLDLLSRKIGRSALAENGSRVAQSTTPSTLATNAKISMSRRRTDSSFASTT